MYPVELCRWTGIGWFRVFRDGLANVGPHASRERIAVVGHERRFSGDRLTLYDFTAERQSDGGFLISAMRHRWPLLEAQMQRQRGDCFAGLILGLGDGCHYPSSRELLRRPSGRQHRVRREESLLRYDDAFVFREWGRKGEGVFSYRPLRDGRQILVRIGADRARSIGSCFVGLTRAAGPELLD